MKHWNAALIRARITEILPEGMVIPRHSADGHFYEVTDPNQPLVKSGWPVYPSVTGKLQILKDESLINYKMNQAIKYFRGFIVANYKRLPTLNDNVLMEEISGASEVAARASQDILVDAGDIGTRIHDLREAIFKSWISSGIRPEDFLSFIPAEEKDVRVVSALRALQKFCVEKDYIPVACELLVYSHELRTAGTLDDLGLMRKVLRESDNKACDHLSETLFEGQRLSVLHPDLKGRCTCLCCGYQYRYEFVLMDIKTSNQFKNHYFFQVCLYWWKFWKLMGKEWKPERCFILKLSKEDGSYKIEDLKEPAKLARYAQYVVKTNEGVDFIKSLRKDNQRTVISL